MSWVDYGGKSDSVIYSCPLFDYFIEVVSVMRVGLKELDHHRQVIC